MTDTSPTGVEASLQRTLKTIGSVVAPTTVVTALLFYFGWVSINTQAVYFGFDHSLLGFSTQDYLLQSISAVFLPLGVALLIALLAFWCHSRLVEWIGPGRPGRVIVFSFAFAGAALFAVGLFGIVRPRDLDPLTPTGFGGGVGLFSYAVYLHRHRLSANPSRKTPIPRASSLPSLNVLAVTLLVALSAVWLVAEYGEWDGRRKAETLVDGLTSRPSVVVYSPKRLELRGIGVREEALAEESSEYAFRYEGLRLLIRSNGRFFLLPTGWSTSGGVTIVLRDREDLRVEFVRS